MALPGFYKVNFTDPRKEGFIIEPYQTNGAISPVSQILDGSAPRADTSLLLYGRDVPNYGERVAENFVQLLENFAGPAQPQNPIEGQLWFDTGTIYTVSAWVSGNTLIFIGDFAPVFNALAANQTTVTLSFNPANSAVDNTFQEIDLKVVSAAAAGIGATSVVFKAADGQEVTLPPTVLGGFVTSSAPGYSRMRVATSVGGSISWIDVTNVISSVEAPSETTRTVGDMWYDQATGDLRIYTVSGWVSVAARYLPLAGGTMTGAIQMGTNKVFSSGTITALSADLYALVNREYVDGIVASLQSQIDTLTEEVDNNNGSVNDDLSKKVNKAGDQMTGALVFGDGTATTTLTRGIDAKSSPIINPQITWDPTDYITASTETHYVVDKQYVARAFSQHLLDQKHGAGGFIQIQEDGTGVFPDSVAFSAGSAGKSYSISWFDVSGNNKHSMYAQFAGATSHLILEAGTDSADTVDIRHSSLTGADPLFRVGAGATASYQSLYIFDGQPQPTYNGTPTAANDDTKGATKGFVRKYLADNTPTPVEPGTTVTAATYSYSVANKQYTLVLKQTGKADLSVNEYHQHDAYDIPYTYKSLSDNLEWVDGDVISDVGPTLFGTLPTTSVGQMFEILNTFKAPVTDAVFTNTPSVGVDAEIVSYNAASKQIVVYGQDISVYKIGGAVAVSGSTSNDGTYPVASVALGGVINNKDTIVITVTSTIPATATENGQAFLAQGTYVPNTEPRGLVTRTTLDVELANSTTTNYLYTKRTTAGTGVVIGTGFTYTPGVNKLWVFRNGQKLRVNTLTGGDFNETSSTSITIATVFANDEFEIYKI